MKTSKGILLDNWRDGPFTPCKKGAYDWINENIPEDFRYEAHELLSYVDEERCSLYSAMFDIIKGLDIPRTLLTSLWSGSDSTFRRFIKQNKYMDRDEKNQALGFHIIDGQTGYESLNQIDNIRKCND